MKIKVKIPAGYSPHKYTYSMTPTGGELEIVCIADSFTEMVKKLVNRLKK